MIELNVELGDRSYPIYIGHGSLKNDALWRSALGAGKVGIVTNQTIAPLYLDRLCETLEGLGKVVIQIVLPDGEKFKNWETLNLIYDALLKTRCDRKTNLIALGGGVIGDMTGFAAATYQRGINYLQVPTTLLAQVDSSVGGKTGINHPLGKNMVGAFHQPRAVIIDLTVLHTLPDRELSAGLAEVIKHAAIADAEFFGWLEANMHALRRREPNAVAWAVRRCCEIKANVVRHDEREGGLRAILNFGHTFGHAIEAGLGYGSWLHGEAVGAGMVMAGELSVRLGLLPQAELDRLRALVQAAGLPVHAPRFQTHTWLNLMAVDKKADSGSIRFIVLKQFGEVEITTAPEQAIVDTIGAIAVLPLVKAVEEMK